MEEELELRRRLSLNVCVCVCVNGHNQVVGIELKSSSPFPLSLFFLSKVGRTQVPELHISHHLGGNDVWCYHGKTVILMSTGQTSQTLNFAVNPVEWQGYIRSLRKSSFNLSLLRLCPKQQPVLPFLLFLTSSRTPRKTTTDRERGSWKVFWR